MADPAIIALLQHLNWSPPAVVQPAPVELTDPLMSAYASYVSRQEADLAAWREEGVALRASIWQATKKGEPSLTLGAIADIVEQFEDTLKQEAVALVRKEKQARRIEKGLRGAERAFVERQHARLLAVASSFHGEGRDFAAFLRALKAELDPDSRGGTSFTDGAALEKHLLDQMA